MSYKFVSSRIILLLSSVTILSQMWLHTYITKDARGIDEVTNLF